MKCVIRSLVLGVLIVSCAPGLVADDRKDDRVRDERGPQGVRLEFRLAQDEPAPGLAAATTVFGERIFIHREVLLTGKDVADARVITAARGKYSVEVAFAPQSRDLVARISERNINMKLAVLVDGNLVSAPRIIRKFSETATINGEFTREEADRIAAGLKVK